MKKLEDDGVIMMKKGADYDGDDKVKDDDDDKDSVDTDDEDDNGDNLLHFNCRQRVEYPCVKMTNNSETYSKLLPRRCRRRSRVCRRIAVTCLCTMACR